MSGRPSAVELLETPGGVLSRSDLRDLGWERRAVDAIFRELDVVFLPGYSRGHVRREDYLELLERCTYRGDRVRPTSRPPDAPSTIPPGARRAPRPGRANGPGRDSTGTCKEVPIVSETLRPEPEADRV